MALVSSILLYNHVFNKSDLENMWPVVEKLLVKKRGKIFGMLLKNVNDKIYFNDYQYHGAVVWPKDNPYLIKYLRIIGEEAKANEILESNLWHQMDEGAIFYNSELFSLPEGKNPSPTKTNNEPVPMKNPIQLWSHFCDVYLDNKKYNNKRNNHGT
jgi:glycogen debranching enzyme